MHVATPVMPALQRSFCRGRLHMLLPPEMHIRMLLSQDRCPRPNPSQHSATTHRVPYTAPVKLHQCEVGRFLYGTVDGVRQWYEYSTGAADMLQLVPCDVHTQYIACIALLNRCALIPVRTFTLHSERVCVYGVASRLTSDSRSRWSCPLPPSSSPLQESRQSLLPWASPFTGLYNSLLSALACSWIGK